MRASMRIAVIAMVCVALLSAAATAETIGWPREIKTEKGKLVIYQPQIDRFEGNILEGRAAISFTAKGKNEPIFGAFWFKALLDTDFDTRMARLVSIQVPQIKWADATKEKQKEVGAFLEREIPKLDIPISIDRLSAAMEEVNRESKGAGDFKHDPPKIVITYEPAVLLFYDGDPILRDIEGAKGAYQQVVNTPLPVVLDVNAKKHYLCGGDVWYVAKDALGPWSPTTDVPEALLAMKKEADRKQQAQPAEKKEKPKGEKPPKIVVATSPTEIVVVFGQANWAPIEGTDLLYVSNSQGNLFKDITTQKTYILLSGRWYDAPSLDGPWTFVAPDKLPGGFAKIPEGSPAAVVLASVPGTQAAKDALLDAEIPQTATIKRSPVTVEVTYDGEPQFKAIEGTKLEFAVNTSYSVIKLESKYYCCSQAVWYVAGAPKGPWQVADKVPDEIYKIPPSNPNYNVTNVYVYDSTPDVVYTGYYPGYCNSYVYGGCVVYGTGWYYPPYVSPHAYYPCHPTWGFGVGWNPYTGWGVGVSWGYGPFSITVGFGGYGGYHGWYGPPGYHPPYYGGYPPRPGVPPGYRPPGGIGGAGNRPGNDPPGVGKPGGGDRPQVNPNIYGKQGNRDRNAATPRDKGVQTADRAGSGANNVYADKNGDVYRRNNDGSWQQRNNGNWSKVGEGPSTRPSTGSGAATRPSTGAGAGTRPSTGASGPSNLNRDYQARSNGANRASAYQGSRGGGASRGGGGARGGGGRGGGGRR